MSKRTARNVKLFLKRQDEAEKSAQTRMLPGRVSVTMPQQDNSAQIAALQRALAARSRAPARDQDEGGSWLGTLAKLGLLGTGGYLAYRYLPKLLEGGGGNAAQIAQRATEAEQLLHEQGSFWSGEQTLPGEMRPNAQAVAKDIIGRGGTVQDVINTIRERYPNYGLGDRSILPFRTDPLFDFLDPVDQIGSATEKLKRLPYGDPQGYMNRALR